MVEGQEKSCNVHPTKLTRHFAERDSNRRLLVSRLLMHQELTCKEMEVLSANRSTTNSLDKQPKMDDKKSLALLALAQEWIRVG